MAPYFCEMSFFVVENISTEKEYENAKMFVQNWKFSPPKNYSA